MSNDLAIATVTATLKYLLENAITGRVQGIDTEVSTGQPDPKDTAQTGKAKVNIFLYQVAANPSWRNADLPTRQGNGSLSQRPQLALDVHYLLSFYGDKSRFVPERLMGIVMKTLHVQPILTQRNIRDAIANSDSLLGESDLAEQPESVKFTPVSLSLEEMSKLWSIFQTPYALSTAYQGSVVLIEPTLRAEESLPVRDRQISVSATPPPAIVPQPLILQIYSQQGAEQPIAPGSSVVIQGRGLTAETIDRIELNRQQIDLSTVTLQATEIILLLPTSLSPGVKTLQIIYQNNLRSNIARFNVQDNTQANTQVDVQARGETV